MNITANGSLDILRLPCTWHVETGKVLHAIVSVSVAGAARRVIMCMECGFLSVYCGPSSPSLMLGGDPAWSN